VKKALSFLIWLCVAVLGAIGYVSLSINRDEPVNSGFILLAAVCTYAIGYRFYSKWIAAKILMLDDRRATPCEVHEDGHDFVKTNKWIVFGHHFAAISGPGPLVGPVLAAQFGYLPGTIWILIGVVLGGAVQDFMVLVASMRRDGRSLAQMVREELTKTIGAVGAVAILSIMIILLAVLGLVVVKALAESPWGVFTVAATIPIAMLMGGYLRWVRVGKVMEISIIGFVLLLFAVWGGNWVSHHQTLKPMFTRDAPSLAWSVIIYGFAASVLPVWLLLAPRDYLSTFLKLGTIFALALGTFIILPKLHMPALTDFAVKGNGPIVPGNVFPVLLHHHRMRRDQRISHADRQRHHAQDHHSGEPRSPDRLRRDVPGVAGGHYGSDCSMHAATGRLPQHKRRWKSWSSKARARDGNRRKGKQLRTCLCGYDG
jgi:carbon starvation protein